MITTVWNRPATMRMARMMLRKESRIGVLRTMGLKSDYQYSSFSTTPPSPPNSKGDDSTSEGDDENTTIQGRLLSRIFTPTNQFYALVAGGSIGAYALSRLFLGFTNFFTHLTPTVIAKWGFYTGFGTASLLGGLAMVTADNLYIRADPVYKYTRDWVVNDPSVQAALGDGIQSGNLRSYRLDAGRMELKGTTNPVWAPPRIQMIFDVTATGPPYRTGLVTCEAVKSGGFPPQLHTTLLKVDYETGNEGEGGSVEGDETLFLRGTAEDLQRVSSRSGLSLEKLARSVHINRAAAEES
mmetsp:Transcript_15076/g.16697  ORF Transcript_15076/g.16697 Transcript_15076/m.16697 type:complete len:297 (+) Transcript_15076:102-992(+)